MPISPEDIGGFGGAKESRKRSADIDFLNRCNAASEDQLRKMLRDHSGKGAPEWKTVVIKRALARCTGPACKSEADGIPRKDEAVGASPTTLTIFREPTTNNRCSK